MAHGADLAAAARAWLGESRRINHDIPQVGAALLHAEQGRRLNVRAVGTPDVGPGMRQPLEALEHSAVSIRAMLRAVVDATNDPRWPDDAGTEDVLLGLAQTFREMAAVVDAFGQQVYDEAGPAQRVSPDGAFSARPSSGCRTRAPGSTTSWAGSTPELLKLHAAVLATVRTILGETSFEERVRRQVRMRPTARPRVPRPKRPSPKDPAPSPHEITPDAETQLCPSSVASAATSAAPEQPWPRSVSLSRDGVAEPPGGSWQRPVGAPRQGRWCDAPRRRRWRGRWCRTARRTLGTIATPRPAATRPSMVARSWLSNDTVGGHPGVTEQGVDEVR